MAKFQKTIDLWANGNEEKIRSGELVLQCGQWVICGSSQKSRFVSVDGFSINVAHGHNNKTVINRFMTRAMNRKQANNLI